MIKYPDSMASVGRKNQTLAADAAFTPLSEDDFKAGVSPMELIKKGSGLRLECADSQKGIGGSGSIEAAKLADVRIRTEIAFQAIMKAEMSGVKAADNSSILDTPIHFVPKEMSEFRGKPARDFINGGFTDAIFIAAVKLLRDNAAKNAKYAAANTKQADALEAARILSLAQNVKDKNGNSLISFCKSLDEIKIKGNQLNAAKDPAVKAMAEIFKYIKRDPANIAIFAPSKSSETSTEVYTIYDAPQKTPNSRKLDKDGMTKAYSLKVTCNPARLPYPFHVELVTFRGKPIPGQMVGVKDCVDYKSFRYDLQSWEWANIVDSAEVEKNLTKLFIHQAAKKASVAARMENIEAAKKS